MKTQMKKYIGRGLGESCVHPGFEVHQPPGVWMCSPAQKLFESPNAGDFSGGFLMEA